MDDEQVKLDSVLQEIYSKPGDMIELLKMQIAFWERLVILNAGTLALSFTATGLFRGHLVGDGGVGFLLAAWKLLIASTALALIAQILMASGAVHLNTRLMGLNQHLSLTRISEALIARGQQLGGAHSSWLVKLDGDIEKAETYSSVLPRVASWLGFGGLCMSIAGFYWLYKFAQLNVGHFST